MTRTRPETIRIIIITQKISQIEKFTRLLTDEKSRAIIGYIRLEYNLSTLSLLLIAILVLINTIEASQSGHDKRKNFFIRSDLLSAIENISSKIRNGCHPVTGMSQIIETRIKLRAF